MITKLNQNQLRELLNQFCEEILHCPQLKVREIILFGSYARGDADDESDIDVMILTDLPREQISEVDGVLSDITSSEHFMDYSVLISPVMQNYLFFKQWIDHLPFYRNINQEGIKLYAA